MAVALDADQEEIVHFSFPIEKQEDTATINPVDGTPDILIRGKATDGTVDADRQIVDPEWSAAALKEWIATGGNVRMSHDPKRPVGKGQDVQVAMDGHYVTSVICDPLAKHFVRSGVLNDYSVGISMPHIKFGPDKALDPRGAATGGIITGRPDGLSKIAELSIVDRGSNFNSKFQVMRKSAGGGAEFVGKMIGDEDEITKAAPAGLLTKSGGTWAAAAQAPDPTTLDVASYAVPGDLSVSFTPNDMMRLMQQKFVSQHYDELALKAVVTAEAGVYKRDIDTATRRRLASQNRALPNLSYPIENHGDADNAVTLALSGHGDVAAAKRLIRSVAREEGWQDILDRLDGKSGGDAEKGRRVPNPLNESDDVSKSEMAVEAIPEPAAEQVAEKTEAPAVVKEAEPDVTKDPESESEPKPKPVKKAKSKKKKLPPWLNKPSSDDDGDKDDCDDDSSCKTAHAWEITDPAAGTVECSKCHTSPAAAAGVTASQMDPAPVGELMESQPPSSVKSGPTPASTSGAVAESMQPVPAHREPDGAPMEAMEKDSGLSDGDNEKPTKLEAATGMKYAKDLAPDPEVAALLRFKACGTGEDLGRLHDLTCPAFHPEMTAKYHPYADLGTLIDSRAWQRKTLTAAAGPLEASLKAQEMWQAALMLKNADPADVNQWRLELHKAFRDANPGPGTFPTPGCVAPGSYNRPVLTDGRGADAVDYGAPNTAPQVATMPPNAQNFDRPPLAAAHQSPSPSHMKWDSGEYPSEQGVPTQLSYAQMEKEHQRMALVRMHEHLSRQFPEVCPLNTVNAQGMDDRPLRGNQPEGHPVPAAAGIGKAIDPEPAPAAPVAAALKAEPEAGGKDVFADADVYKGFKKMRKKLGKKVLSGSMTVDEARAKLGRQFAQKGAEPPAEAVQKGAAVSPHASERVVAPRGSMILDEHGNALWPAGWRDGAPAPVAASLDPEVIKTAVAEATADLKDLLVKQQEDFTTRLAEQQKVIDAIADQPDPSTASFSGLAFKSAVKPSRPAGVTDIAEAAARAQLMVRRNLENTYYNHSDPSTREAAGQSLANLGREAAT